MSHVAKSIIKTILPESLLRRLRPIWLLREETWPSVPFDNTYPWLNHTFLKRVQDRRYAQKPHYLWGVLQGAALAKVLEIERISVLEFGVAGGYGLLALEAAAEVVGEETGVEIDVFGFDTGEGLPKPADIRDQPNMWFEGQLPMDRQALESRLRTGRLVIGPVKETAPRFMSGHPAPIAFVSFDLDLYTSTRDAFAVFQSGHDRLLPRVPTYFDDIFGHSYNEYCGERLAIREFNAQNEERKIDPMHGLRYFLPRIAFFNQWPDCMYTMHCFDHPQYTALDSINKAVITDIEGGDIRRQPDSDWMSELHDKT